MPTFDREELLKRKAELQAALQNIADEYQKLLGAIQLIDVFVAELEEPQGENNDSSNHQ